MFNAIFVILGAALWASDTLFRHPMTQNVSALTIVFLEHAFALLIASIWVFVIQRKKLQLGWTTMVGAMLIGLFGSALATVAFTMSFQHVNPSVSILLQKIQPIVVIFLSWIFLGEKLSFKFFLWGAIALVAAFYMSFPHGLVVHDLQDASIVGVGLALIAALLWAISTVIGKVVLKKISGSQLTLWRFLFGFLSLWIILQFVPQSKFEIPLVTNDNSIMTSIFFMALVPGFLGVALYYRGLTRLKASIATILELTFPLCAMFINSRFLGFHLENIQLAAAVVLMLSIVKISQISTKNNN